MNHQAHAVFNEFGEEWGLSFGLTPVSAAQFLQREFPDVKQWMAWNMAPDRAERALQVFVGEGLNNTGTVGTWRWERVPCSYGSIGYWSSSTKKTHLGPCWTGMLRVTGAKGENFLLFSYIRVDMKFNGEYLVSTGDMKMLRRFADDVLKHIRPRRRRNVIEVAVIGGPGFQLKVNEMEKVYLPDPLRQDIYAQVDTFFNSRDVYRKMNIPHKRGFLFTGLPGTGKTMLIRNLIRHCHKEYGAGSAYLAVNRRTDAEDLRMFFYQASEKNPTLLVLEDVESLCQETQLTRSEVLATLDGISQHTGMLLIATANDPGRIDPALMHRPSRFDRLWTFPLPDTALRTRYINDYFENIEPRVVDHLVTETNDWTFAYIKELRNTAAILAINDGCQSMEARHLKEALGLLRDQFKAGRSGHKDANKTNSNRVGFDAARKNDLDDVFESVAWNKEVDEP